LGLFAAQEMFEQAAEGEGGSYVPAVTLAEMTGAAVEILSRNPEGFFLMVEESAIDRMAHRNNAPLTLKGVLELDRAVQVALAYAEQDPETLVIVTADHETGGMAVAGSADAPYPYEPGGGLLDTLLAGEDGPFPVADEPFGFVVGWATTGHTAATVPVSAVGPGAEALAGFYENTRLFEVVAESLGLLEGWGTEKRSVRTAGLTVRSAGDRRPWTELRSRASSAAAVRAPRFRALGPARVPSRPSAEAGSGVRTARREAETTTPVSEESAGPSPPVPTARRRVRTRFS
jgi:hypothetical protein